MDDVWLLLPLGVGAGALTTVAGVGGGVLLTLALSLMGDPRSALAVVAPPLLLGNLHRLWLLRAHVDRRVGTTLGLSAAAGALAGAMIAAALSPAVIRWSMLAIAMLAVARELGWLAARVPRAWLAPAGAFIGFVTATSGGGGLVLAPTLLATGLRGAAFVATGAVVAASIHVGRIVGYGGTGLLGLAHLQAVVCLAAAILVGNRLGVALRHRIAEHTAHRITWLTLAVGIALAVFGVSLG